MTLPDSKEIEELEQRLEQHSKDEEKALSDGRAPQEKSMEEEKDKNETPNKQKSPWQVGVYHVSLKGERPCQLEDIVEEKTPKPHFRRSKRTRN